MEWTAPRFSPKAVNRAGRALVDATATFWDDEYERAIEVVNNWRASHSFPLNTFKVALRDRTKKVDQYGLVAQRIKRLPSILAKLRNQPTMRLAQMQDIGGCRSMVKTVAQVKELARLYERYGEHQWDHCKDYILKPKVSGYRGIHVIYRYFNKVNPRFNGLKIEIQLRTRLQHAWATAVETVGMFMRQALKASQGEQRWLRFFALMGTAIANAERTEPIPGTPTNLGELRDEIAEHALNLDVQSHLISYGIAIEAPSFAQPVDSRHFLLELDTNEISVTVKGYKKRDLQKAQADLAAKEKEIAGRDEIDVVLVSVESLASLKRAYPNYFADTHIFLRAMKQAIDPGVPGSLNTLPRRKPN
jgi:ppGpp synthetase/RelA/SpoT-type nucleotidyltranferase